jgi:hypothetical protein
MLSTHHNGRRATSPSMGRSLRLATVLAAVVALTPPAIAGARVASRLDDGPGAVAADHVQCPCNAGLPVGVAPAYASDGRQQVQAPASTAVRPIESDGFDWGDAGTGAGIAVVLGGLFLVAARVRAKPLPG